jgi:hypothetical protein
MNVSQVSDLFRGNTPLASSLALRGTSCSELTRVGYVSGKLFDNLFLLIKEYFFNRLFKNYCSK